MNNSRLQLLRVRNLGEVVSDSFGFYAPHWKLFAMVVGPAVMIGILVQLLLLLLLPDADRFNQSGLTNEEAKELLRDSLPALGVLLALAPVAWVIYQLTTAAAVVAVVAIGEGRTVEAGDALDAAQDRVKDLLLASLRSGIIIILLFITIIGIPWAIKRVIQWSLIVQSIMIDGTASEPSLAHSASLVEGSWWYTLGRLIVAGLVVAIPGQVAAAILGGIFPGAVGVILAGCVAFFTLPYPIIATTLIFYDQKARKASSVDVAAGL